MKTYILTIIVLLSLFSCNNRETTKVERKGQPTIYRVTDDDVEMNQAIEKANQTLGNFKAALLSHNRDCMNFAIKMRFDTPKGGEHIWIDEVTFIENNYFGVVDNLPESTTEVHLGDTIQIDKSRISDWMYLEKGKLYGGYTVRVLRKRMTPAEQKQFDKENNIIFAD